MSDLKRYSDSRSSPEKIAMDDRQSIVTVFYVAGTSLILVVTEQECSVATSVHDGKLNWLVKFGFGLCNDRSHLRFCQVSSLAYIH